MSQSERSVYTAGKVQSGARDCQTDHKVFNIKTTIFILKYLHKVMTDRLVKWSSKSMSPVCLVISCQLFERDYLGSNPVPSTGINRVMTVSKLLHRVGTLFLSQSSVRRHD